MERPDWTIHEKPCNLRERLFRFACLDRPAGAVPAQSADRWSHFRTSCSSAAPPPAPAYEEADDGSSPRDALAKKKIALRELKETRFRLRVLRQAGILTAAHDPVLNERAELVEIVATVVRHASQPTSRRDQP